MLCPGRLRDILKLCLNRVVYVLPGQADHRVLVDDELVHFENCVLDPVMGVLPDLFDVGGKTSRRHANAIEEQLLEMIEEREGVLRTHFHHDAVRIARISHSAFCLARVFR